MSDPKPLRSRRWDHEQDWGHDRKEMGGAFAVVSEWLLFRLIAREGQEELKQLALFHLCEKVYGKDGATSKKAHTEKCADKRSVWVMGFDGSNPRVLEPLHDQTTTDGSLAPWCPVVTQSGHDRALADQMYEG